MKVYVVRKGNQHYAVIYEGLDPLPVRERRRRHPPEPTRPRQERSAPAARKAAWPTANRPGRASRSAYT